MNNCMYDFIGRMLHNSSLQVKMDDLVQIVLNRIWLIIGNLILNGWWCFVCSLELISKTLCLLYLIKKGEKEEGRKEGQTGREGIYWVAPYYWWHWWVNAERYIGWGCILIWPSVWDEWDNNFRWMSWEGFSPMYNISCLSVLVDRRLVDSASSSWFSPAYPSCVMGFGLSRCLQSAWTEGQRYCHASSWWEAG